jgi:hypothetical protein
MFVNAAIAVMSVAAVGFDLTFPVALFKECEPQETGYWVVYDAAPAKIR